MKRWAPRLALRRRLKVIRKWPIYHFFFSSESNKEEGEEFPQPRRFFHRICTHGYFDLGISAVIVLNVICMAMEHYNQPEVSYNLMSNISCVI